MDAIRPKWMAIYMDATGLPRAWGLSPNKDDAEAIAKLELEAYRDEHHDRQEPFTLRFHRIDFPEDGQ